MVLSYIINTYNGRRNIIFVNFFLDNIINTLIKKHHEEKRSLARELKEKFEQEKNIAVEKTKLKQWSVTNNIC